MGKNVVFLVIFDTCDVTYNWFISLLPPIVLENPFDYQYHACLKKGGRKGIGEKGIGGWRGGGGRKRSVGEMRGWGLSLLLKF